MSSQPAVSGREPSAMADPFRALYLHVPFCVRRCAYCDFATRAASCDDPALDAHVSRLAGTLGQAARGGLLDAVETVYIGGGTPTFLGAARLARLLDALDGALLCGAASLRELTVEANPDSLTDEVLDVLAGRGVSRLSIGVQSLDDEVLATLGRVHDAEAARQAVRAGVARIGNVSADVICGVPGQTLGSLQRTIGELVGLGVSHASVYPLMVEEGTPLEAAIAAGDLPDVDDDAQADHMLAAAGLLEEAGLRRYEVASYALPGRESRHNVAYWTGVPYLGLGPGAASMLDAGDLQAVADTGVFGEAGSGFDVPTDAVRARVSLAEGSPEFEFLTAREAACEDAMLAMRMSAGLSRARLDSLAERAPELLDAADRAVERELASWRAAGSGSSPEALAPTSLGWLNGNELYGLFWECAHQAV